MNRTKTGGDGFTKSVRIVLTFFLVLLIVPPPALSQPSAASITGYVVAEDGTGLPGSVIWLTADGGDRPVRVVAGERGLFRADLVPGTWSLEVKSPGFSPTSLGGIRIGPGESKDVVVRLALSTIKEAVTVIGASPRESVEAAEIRESPARDVGEALSASPGLWKFRKGGIANDVILRGYQSESLNVLVDGQRIYGACPSHMDPPAFHADFAEVQRVEVGKGPFDVKNQGSLGGVVNIVTRRPDDGWQATANLAGGSASYVNPSATLSYRTPSFYALGGYSWRKSDAYRDGTGKRFTEITNYRPDAVDASAFEASTAWGKLGFSPAAGQQIEVAYTHQAADQVFYPALMMDGTWDRADRVNVTYDITPRAKSGTAVKVQGYYAAVDHWMTDQYRTSAGTASLGYSMATMADTWTAGGKLEASFFAELTAGVEVYHRYWNTATTMLMMGSYMEQASLPAAESGTAGLYAEWKHPLSPKVSLVAGARVDRVFSSADAAIANTNLYWAYNGTRSTSWDGVVASGNVRAIYRPVDGLEISGGVGSVGRAPEPNEMYFALARKGTDWVGNPGLSPGQNTGVDAAVSYRGSRFFASASLFANWVNGFVIVHGQPRANMVPGVMNATATSYANVDATLLGGELTGVATLTDQLFLSGDVSWVRGSQAADPARGITSTNLQEMPPLRGRAALRWDNGRFFAEAEGVFSAAQNRVDADIREQPTPGWGVGNLKAGANVASFTLTIGVGNLFDRAYYESMSYVRDPYRSGVRVPEPGRTVFANLGWRY